MLLRQCDLKKFKRSPMLSTHFTFLDICLLFNRQICMPQSPVSILLFTSILNFLEIKTYLLNHLSVLYDLYYLTRQYVKVSHGCMNTTTIVLYLKQFFPHLINLLAVNKFYCIHDYKLEIISFLTRIRLLLFFTQYCHSSSFFK